MAEFFTCRVRTVHATYGLGGITTDWLELPIRHYVSILELQIAVYFLASCALI
jgi:hypothetical protein